MIIFENSEDDEYSGVLGGYPTMAKVLVANDDATARRVLRLSLQRAGYEVEEASTKQQTLLQLRTSKIPLIVLLDFNMSRWDGLAILDEVAQDDLLVRSHAYILMLLRDQTVSMMTAKSIMDTAVTLVPKPIKITTILSAVNAAAHRLSVQDEHTVRIPRYNRGSDSDGR